MRIALVHMRHAHTGGTERYLNDLAAYLADRGHDVCIVCRRHEAAPHPRVRFEVLRGPAVGKAWRLVTFARAVERHVARASYDLVFGLGKTWTHDVVRLGGGLHGTFLESTRVAPAGMRGESLQRALRNRVALSIEKRALAPGAYRCVVTNSDMVRRDVQRVYGVPPERMVTIHNGVDLERFHPRLRASVGAALRAELGLSANLVVLFLGTGYARKGLDLVLDAFPAVARARPDARLVVAGFDSAPRKFEALARARGVADRVRWLGGRSDPEACYAAADLYVLPTRYDPFANSTLEALASGLPVITSATNGGSELLRSREDGSVVDVLGGPAALEAELLHWADPDRLAAASPSARATAERHGIESKLAETERLLLGVAEGAGTDCPGGVRRSAATR